MKKNTYLKYFAGAFFFLMMLLDGQLTRLLERWTQDNYIASAHLLLIAFLCGARYLPKNYLIIIALIIGCLYDLYYIGIIGIYAVAFPMIVWIMYILNKTLYQNIFTMFFGMIIFVTGLEMVTLGIQLLFKIATVNTSFFVSRFLAPTLLLNIILFVILVIPFMKLFKEE
ncbi:rod shape-determining protein MreD [Enterococcus gallinarum]|uniref:Rod shape-determining protein MreD n=1 Tax=Enterococcus gallinarum TaxID=1353 RepID=A0AAE7MSV1_ENTGA|nr:rod shape-determining protein MreD [Enterococcus gallinarum]EEV34101.1 rod shape-determining protein MreD [Enterococcus gallinarum EG2]MBM6739682.1 rod shape-determining protein MreD [Enterococcus gallinarum]NQE03223.1 rod shape-determining protein MreD [Enterococcus gallinarum]QOG29025.1 rod shape-determining protein MreD [Enterococcus gallinarum]RBT44206.1 rod shape-determining protein MreD [Enterococcus gallinarum]